MEESVISHIPAAVTNLLLEDFGEITSVKLLTSGHINKSKRIMTASQVSFVLKQNIGTQGRLFECEAAGLQALRSAGMRTPDVLLMSTDFLLLEDLGVHNISEPAWEEFGRAVARQHLHTNTHYGFDYDNYLGPLPQVNTWMEDGHEFFGQHRVLRYLKEPRCEQALTQQDRQGLERLVKRLPDLIPAQPPALVHGDLWYTNMLVDDQSRPALIDPAIYYGWPEAELSMTRQYGIVPRIFYDAYNEVNPLREGWWERLELLYIRQHMAVLAFFGNQYNTLQQLRDVVRKFN